MSDILFRVALNSQREVLWDYGRCLSKSSVRADKHAAGVHLAAIAFFAMIRVGTRSNKCLT